MYLDARHWDTDSLLLLLTTLKGDTAMGHDDFTKENVLEVLETLFEELHDMRRHGETDIRTVISHVNFAIKEIRGMKEHENR